MFSPRISDDTGDPWTRMRRKYGFGVEPRILRIPLISDLNSKLMNQDGQEREVVYCGKR